MVIVRLVVIGWVLSCNGIVIVVGVVSGGGMGSHW